MGEWAEQGAARRWLLLAGIALTTLTTMAAFFCVVSFVVAVTPAEAASKGGPSMPLEWEAGVLNHGEYYEWYTISRHPVAFGLSVAALVASSVCETIFFLKWRRAKAASERAGNDTRSLLSLFSA